MTILTAPFADFCTNPQAPPTHELAVLGVGNVFCRRMVIDGNYHGQHHLAPAAFTQQWPLIDVETDYSGYQMKGKPAVLSGDSSIYYRWLLKSFDGDNPSLMTVAHVEPSHFNIDDFACNPHFVPSNYATGVLLGVDCCCNPHMYPRGSLATLAWSATDLQQNPQGSIRVSGTHVVPVSGLDTVTYFAGQSYSDTHSSLGISFDSVNRAPTSFSINKRSSDGRLPEGQLYLNGNKRQPQLKRGAIRLNSKPKSQTSFDATAATVTKKQDRPVSGGVGYLEQPLLLPVDALRDNHFQWF